MEFLCGPANHAHRRHRLVWNFYAAKAQNLPMWWIIDPIVVLLWVAAIWAIVRSWRAKSGSRPRNAGKADRTV
jgi:hypothetical protein